MLLKANSFPYFKLKINSSSSNDKNKLAEIALNFIFTLITLRSCENQKHRSFLPFVLFPKLFPSGSLKKVSSSKNNLQPHHP